jgi:nucleoside-diphosphate-sugar epimerase
MRRVLITGSAGVIGTVLSDHLPYDITGLDLPDNDIGDYPRLVENCRGQDAIIHLAGEFTTENWRSDDINPANFRLDLNVLKAAVEADVRRVVLASSVHADDFLAHNGPELIAPDRALPVPTSPYGAHKLFLEAAGRHVAAHHGREVVALRFGGVRHHGLRINNGLDAMAHLSHPDLVACVQAAVEAPLPPSRFAVLYAVSDNPRRVHDTTNPLGWKPLPRTAHP